MSRLSASDVDAAAARWVARIDADDWTDPQEAELQAWIALDSRHEGALLRAQAAWITLDAPAIAGHQMGLPTQDGRLSRRRVLAGGGLALAASLAGGVFLLSGGTNYTTAVGEIRRIPLADGSTAAINTASKIEVKLAETARMVRIDHGEAWFQVAKDPERPFIVEAGRVRVQAIGTAFSVRLRDTGADILVTEGVVEAWAAGAEGHKIRLAAGSQAFIADNAAIELVSDAASSVDRALAWRSGKINLAGERLDSAVADFNRYNERKLVLADPALGAEQLDGVFRTDDPEGFANAVRSTLATPVDTSNPEVIRIGRSSD
jgi:transmembrane sensor